MPAGCAERVNECTCESGDESDGQFASQEVPPQDVEGNDSKESVAPTQREAAPKKQKEAAPKQKVAPKRRRLAASSASEEQISSSSSDETSESADVGAAPGLPRQASLGTTNPAAMLALLKNAMY